MCSQRQQNQRMMTTLKFYRFLFYATVHRILPLSIHERSRKGAGRGIAGNVGARRTPVRTCVPYAHVVRCVI